jgi:ADP-heptose:LPS heptosyltransferase
MRNYSNIVVFQPGALSDIVMATPVAKTLKENYPGSKITYWTDVDAIDMLLAFCPSVDEAVEYDYEAPMAQHQKTFAQLQPDLFVDLTLADEGKALTRFSKTTLLKYKRPANPRSHEVDVFLSTLDPLQVQWPDPVFPTIFPEAMSQDFVPQLLDELGLTGKQLVGIAPGVNPSYAHRSWLQDGWGYLIEHIVSMDAHVPVLMSLTEWQNQCDQLAAPFGPKVVNLAGMLKTSQMAAVIDACAVLVACDNFQAHLAAAVGTPVISLHGPTSGERRAPLGNEALMLDQHESCECIGKQHCQFAAAGEPAKCMNRIMLSDITAKLRLALHIESEFGDGSY